MLATFCLTCGAILPPTLREFVVVFGTSERERKGGGRKNIKKSKKQILSNQKSFIFPDFRSALAQLPRSSHGCQPASRPLSE